MKFNTNENRTCSGEKPTKLLITQENERLREQLVSKKADMKALSKMFGDYTYNDAHLREMVGACYISISNMKSYLKANTKKLKTFKSE